MRRFSLPAMTLGRAGTNITVQCVRSGCGHAWTPRRDFAVSKSVTQSLTVGSAALQKAGAHRVTLRADPVRARHGPTGGPGLLSNGRGTPLPSRTAACETRSLDQ